MALREILAHFGIDVDTEELEKANRSIDNFIGRLKELGTAVIGGEFAKQIFDFGERIAEQGDQLEKASIRLGISTDALQALGYAAVQSGSDMGQLTFALLTLQDKIGDALINKAGDGAKTFSKLGINIHDANGNVKDAGDLLSDVADRIGKAKSQAEKTAIAMEVFGRQGKSLLPLLEGGSEGLAKLREEFDLLGGGIREKAIKAASKYTETLGKLHVVHDGLTGQIGVVLLPVLDRMIDVITKAELEMIHLADSSSVVQTVLGSLGAILVGFAVKSVIAFAPWIAWGVALAAVVIAIEDLVTMFRGGDSLTGRLLDSIGGKDTHVEVVKELGNAWRDIKDAFAEIKEDIKPFWDFLKWIADHDSSLRMLRGLSHALGRGADAYGKYKVQQQEDEAVAGGFDQAVGAAYYDNSARRQAADLISASSRGEAYHPSEFPGYYAQHKEDWKQKILEFAKYQMSQQRQMAQATSMIPGMGYVVQQANTINIQGVTDPEKIAKVVHGVIKERAAAAGHVLHKKAEPK